MKKGAMINIRLVAIVIVLGILSISMVIGALNFNVLPVQAQTADGDAGESEGQEADDSAEGPDTPITGAALEQASVAALSYIGEGRVTDTEVGDEEGYYEVEITRDNGRQVDVHLDETFQVLGHEDD